MKREKVSYERLLSLVDEAQEIRAPVELFYDVKDHIPITKAQVLQILATDATPESYEYEVIWKPEKGQLFIN